MTEQTVQSVSNKECRSVGDGGGGTNQGNDGVSDRSGTNV